MHNGDHKNTFLFHNLWLIFHDCSFFPIVQGDRLSCPDRKMNQHICLRFDSILRINIDEEFPKIQSCFSFQHGLNAARVCFSFDNICFPMTKHGPVVYLFWSFFDTDSVCYASPIQTSAIPWPSFPVLSDQIFMEVFLLSFLTVNVVVNGFVADDCLSLIVAFESSCYLFWTPSTA